MTASYPPRWAGPSGLGAVRDAAGCSPLWAVIAREKGFWRFRVLDLQVGTARKHRVVQD